MSVGAVGGGLGWSRAGECRQGDGVACCRVPECFRESDVDFLETAVGDIVDGAGKAWRQFRGERGLVALEPAEGTSDDDFIEGVAFAGFSG